MKTKNTIPTAYVPLVTLAAKAVDGTARLESTVNLLHNRAAVVRTFYRALVGDPDGVVEVPALGKQGEFCEAVAQHAAARRALAATMQTARQFASAAIGLLKNSFGGKINPRWRNAGFTFRTLSVPRDPAGVLVEFRAYYRLHPERQSAEQDLTAARADGLLAELQERAHAVAAKRAGELVARRARNAAQAALARCLSNLRSELAQLLSKDDARWYEFGFKRPIDGRVPAPVANLRGEPGLPDEVRATWDASPTARNYRVKWHVDEPGAEEHEVGLVAEERATLRDLPGGARIVISVSARNRSGESAATELGMVVPLRLKSEAAQDPEALRGSDALSLGSGPLTLP